jgi:hypothetical protein
MDRRLKLTAKQKELVKEVEKAFAALEKEHVGIIFDVDSREFRLYNSAEILDYDNSEEYSQLEDEYYEEPYGDYLTETEDGCLWYSPKLFDLESLSANIMMTDYESWFAVELKENEDSDVFFRSKKIVELEKELKTNQKKLKRHLDGIAQAKSNIGIFREKGLAQDLIDEENASILSNQEAADNIQQVIGELESEIDQLRKV